MIKDGREEENFVVECLFRRGSVSPLLTMMRVDKLKSFSNLLRDNPKSPQGGLWIILKDFTRGRRKQLFSTNEQKDSIFN